MVKAVFHLYSIGDVVEIADCSASIVNNGFFKISDISKISVISGDFITLVDIDTGNPIITEEDTTDCTISNQHHTNLHTQKYQYKRVQVATH